MKRASGYVANIRYEKSGQNVSKPASSAIVLKVMWVDKKSGIPKFVFARTTAHASNFAPRLIAPCSFAHISLGDIASGVLGTPFSDQCSTNLISWDVPEAALLLRIHGAQLPDCKDIVLEPGVVGDLPQLGGGNFYPCPNLSSMCSLRLELPPADINTFKENAAKQEKLQGSTQTQIENPSRPPHNT